MVTSRIIRKGDAAFLEVNGEALLPYGYMSYQPENADYPAFREAGFRLLFVPVYTGDRGINPSTGTRPFYPGIWRAPDVFDFSAPDELFRIAVGDAKPGEVYIIPRFMLEPPSFWEAAHPDALSRDYSGKSSHQSYSSKVWLRDTAAVMERFQEWLETSGWDEYIAGWHLAAGSTEEFILPVTHELQMLDYSAVSAGHWREFLAEKYGAIASLNASWGTAYPDFSDIPVPTPAQRKYAPEGARFRLPNVADYYRFHCQEVAEAVCALAHEAKRITGGQRVIGAFYGYVSAELGHDAMDTVLECPDLDFFASPFTYRFNRAPGIDWSMPGPVDSCPLHGKTWFMENDIRTHLSRPISMVMPRANPAGNSKYDGPLWWGPDTEEMSLHQMKKTFAKTLSHGASLWWFDMWGGWYRTEAYMGFHRKAKAFYAEQVLSRSFVSAAQTVLVYDMDASGVLAGYAGYDDAFLAMSGTGAPFTQSVLTDLPLIDPDRYRALVLLNVSSLTREQEAALERWKRGGRSVIRICSIYPDSPGPLPGYTRALAEGTVRVTPDMQEYRFDATPSSAVLREALLTAGVHIYAFTGDIVYAGGRMVAIHAASDGEKRIYLPHKGSLEDVFTGERPEPVDHFTDFSMKKGETRIFRIRFAAEPNE